jgi:hypothetical protein
MTTEAGPARSPKRRPSASPSHPADVGASTPRRRRDHRLIAFGARVTSDAPRGHRRDHADDIAPSDLGYVVKLLAAEGRRRGWVRVTPHGS